jgi:hypothetical protein
MAVNRLNVGATNQLLAKASSGQSTNILELQNTAGVTVAGVDANGNGVGGLTAPTAAGKNKIINGDFNIWQRGTSFTTNGVYTADRFVMGFGGTGTAQTVSQQTFTAGTAPVSGYEGTYFCRNAVTGGSGTGSLVVLTQKIEDVRTFAGQTVTLSFWAKANSGTPFIGVDLYQEFGTTGSPSATVSNGGTKVTISTSWARYSVTIAVASVAGKTITSNSLLGARLWFSSGSDYNSLNGSMGIQSNTFDIWGWQVEAGAIATPFVPAGGGGIGAELALCQRYYQKSYNQSVFAGATGTEAQAVIWSSVTTGAYGSSIPVFLKVPMRAAPTVTIYNPSTGASGSIYGLSAANSFNGIPDYINQNSFAMYATATQSPAGYLIGANYVAQIEL